VRIDCLSIFWGLARKNSHLYQSANDRQYLKEFTTHKFKDECCQDADEDASQNGQNGILQNLAFSPADNGFCGLMLNHLPGSPLCIS
jgi:hypothetical protein